MKILVADDDSISLRLMQRILQRSGYDVVTATDGTQALEQLSLVGGPRLALVDWMMPQLDGLALCRQVRARNDDRYVYIILLTAKGQAADIVAGLEAGADDYLTKPCRPAELGARLRTGQRILQLEDKLIEAREEMRFKATHDALTSLWDRGAILALARAAMNRSSQQSFPLSLILCDIDHFKQINDLHGHLAGDEVLREAARRLRAVLRSTDTVGRYGGEEFLLVLSGCPRAKLQSVAEQVRRAFDSRPFVTTYGTIPVSISAGAVAVEDWDGSIPVEAYLNVADTALYEAKRSGRNRIALGDVPLTKLPWSLAG